MGWGFSLVGKHLPGTCQAQVLAPALQTKIKVLFLIFKTVSSVTGTGFFFPKALPAAVSTKSMKNLHNIGKNFKGPKTFSFTRKCNCNIS